MKSEVFVSLSVAHFVDILPPHLVLITKVCNVRVIIGTTDTGRQYHRIYSKVLDRSRTSGRIIVGSMICVCDERLR